VAPRDVKLTVGTLAKVLLWIVYAWVVINLVMLFLAFWLRLFGANPEAGFTQWVYRAVSRAMAPFRGIFEPIALTDQSVLDTSLLFAMIIYGLVALLLRVAIDWATGLVDRHRRQLEQQAWAAQTAGGPPAAVGMTAGPPPSVTQPAAGFGHPDAVVPASPPGTPLGPPT
jgi:uncharacterized protein YggT (Ycf19 family)